LKLSLQLKGVKLQTIRHLNLEQKSNVCLMTEAMKFSETLDLGSKLKRLVARKDFIMQTKLDETDAITQIP
jgi:aminopeptidase C